MFATLLYLRQSLEALMLFCFGASWPFSIARSIRTRSVTGKSPIFLSLVLTGYVAGVAMKLIQAADANTRPEPVTLFYAFNGLLVLADLLVYFYLRKHGRTELPT